MKKLHVLQSISMLLLMSAAMLCGFDNQVAAQPGPRITLDWDLLPFQGFSEPAVDLENAEIRMDRSRASLSYPLIFSEGRTVIVNEFSYQYMKVNYGNWPGSTSEPDVRHLHSGQYTLMLQRRMSERWSLWAMAIPGFASDLRGEFSSDDLNLQAVVLFIKHYSARFSLGLGAAYSTQFGEPIPLPVLGFDWNNGSNLKIRGIIPSSLELGYKASNRLNLGLNLSVQGNDYHGDPDIYTAADPRLKYSLVTIAPSASYRISRLFSLKFEAGLVGLQRFEFYDGDEKIESYDMKQSQFVRFGLELGG